MQTELHRHLDVSIRTSTLLHLAQAKGLESHETSYDQFREKLIIREPLRDLNTVLAKFELFPRVLDRLEVIEQVAFEAVEDCYLEGTRQVEYRYSPAFVTEFSGLSWNEVLHAFEKGIKKAQLQYTGMRVGLICIASRDFGIDEVSRTIEFFLNHRKHFVGFDLAGNETDYPCRMFEEAFKPLVALGASEPGGAPITIHAGEASGPENMWEAIALLGAKRIGHGIRCVEDPRLMTYLAEQKICLEMCPTSNWLTRSVASIAEHPLPRVLRAGIPVCINTDDPGIFGVTLGHERELCRSVMGMSEDEIELCNRHAVASSFIPS